MAADQGAGYSDADGGPVRHIPVLLPDVLASLDPGPGKVILDGTFGAGGYTSAILDAGADVIALDRDPAAIAGGRRQRIEHFRKKNRNVANRSATGISRASARIRHHSASPF